MGLSSVATRRFLGGTGEGIHQAGRRFEALEPPFCNACHSSSAAASLLNTSAEVDEMPALLRTGAVRDLFDLYATLALQTALLDAVLFVCGALARPEDEVVVAVVADTDSSLLDDEAAWSARLRQSSLCVLCWSIGRLDFDGVVAGDHTRTKEPNP